MTKWINRFCQSLAAAKYKASAWAAGRADFEFDALGVRRMLSGLMFLCLALGITARASAQNVQLVSTSLNTTCSRAEYNVTFVSARGQLQNGTTVKSLGLALIPRQKGNETKIFSFYWFSTSSIHPDGRDDTGNVAGKLYQYRPDVLAEFFTNGKINCAFSGDTTKAIEKLMESSRGLLNAAQFVTKLKKEASPDIKDEPPKDGTLDPASGFANPEAFANAVRKSIEPVDEPKTLRQEIQRLKEDVAKYETAANTNQQQVAYLESLIPKGDNRLNWLLILLIPVTLAVIAGTPLVYWKSRNRFNQKDMPTPDDQPVRVVEMLSTNLWPEVEAKLRTIFEAFHRHLESNKKNPSASREKVFNRLPEEVLKLIESYGKKNDTSRKRIDQHLTEIVSQSIKEYEPRKLQREPAREVLNKLEEQIKQVCLEVISREPERADRFAVNTEKDEDGKGQSEAHLSLASLAYAKQLDGFIASFAGQGEILPTIEKAQNDLKEMWLLCSTPNEPYPADCLHKVIDKSKGVLRLFQTLSNQFQGQSPQDIGRSVGFLLGELKTIHQQCLEPGSAATTTPEDILKALNKKLAADEKQLEAFDRQNHKVTATKRTFSEIFGYDDEDVFQAAQRMAKDQQEAMALLLNGRSGNGENLTKAVSRITTDLNYVKDMLDREVTGIEGSLRDKTRKMVDKYYNAEKAAQDAGRLKQDLENLQTKFDTAESQLTDGKSLSAKVTDLLHFNKQKINDSDRPISALLSKLMEEPDQLWQLRLRLSAALLILDRAVTELKVHDRKDIVDALKIPHIKSCMEAFLLSLEDGHLVQAVDQGFANNWLHDLFRANLLLRTYFSDNDSSNANGAMTQVLQDAVDQATVALKLILYEFGYTVLNINLLKPLPEGVEREGIYKELRQLPEVRHRIRREIKALQENGTLPEAVHKKIVVDVFSFPFIFGAGERASGRVATLNPSDWLQD